MIISYIVQFSVYKIYPYSHNLHTQIKLQFQIQFIPSTVYDKLNTNIIYMLIYR